MNPQAAWNGAKDLPGSQNFNKANAPTQQTLHDFFGPPTFKTVKAAWFCNRLLVGAYFGEDQACEKGWNNSRHRSQETLTKDEHLEPSTGGPQKGTRLDEESAKR